MADNVIRNLNVYKNAIQRKTMTFDAHENGWF